MLFIRNRKPQVSRRRRIESAIARRMTRPPAIGITQLKNHVPDGSIRAAGVGGSARYRVTPTSGIGDHIYNLVDYMRRSFSFTRRPLRYGRGSPGFEGR